MRLLLGSLVFKGWLMILGCRFWGVMILVIRKAGWPVRGAVLLPGWPGCKPRWGGFLVALAVSLGAVGMW
jgi:hypothetical protein